MVKFNCSDSTKKEIIAGRESLAVHMSKIFVLVVITLAAFLLGYFTSMHLTDQQRVRFQSEVRNTLQTSR